jgi:hypothetical protein
VFKPFGAWHLNTLFSGLSTPGLAQDEVTLHISNVAQSPFSYLTISRGAYLVLPSTDRGCFVAALG